LSLYTPTLQTSGLTAVPEVKGGNGPHGFAIDNVNSETIYNFLLIYFFVFR